MSTQAITNNLEFFQERVSYLEESNRRLVSILEMLASSSEFQADLSRAKSGGDIFNATASQLRRLFSFISIGFFACQDDGSFELETSDPVDSGDFLQSQIELRMMDGTFAWALNRSQAVTVPIDAGENGETMLLQVVATQSRIRGMFVATQSGSSSILDVAALNALSIVLFTCAYALESTTLYSMLRDQNQHLEERVELRTKDLEVARCAAETASIAKSEFLAHMSHEIRTPMNGVIGMTELMLKGGLSVQKEQQYLNAIKDSADSLMHIINEILDFSKIEAGKFTLEKAPFSLKKDLEHSLSGLKVRAEGKGLELLDIVHSSVPACLLGDSGRLRQVLTNLVGNALKFCQEGRITIEVSLDSCVDEYVDLKFSVSDTGIGISEEACKRIFNQFEQADNSTTRKFGGTGLGLSISKKLVELMDGRIWVESQLGVGSSFIFLARFQVGNEDLLTTETDESVSVGNSRMAPLSILLADDVEINRALVFAILEPLGHTIIGVDDGQKAHDAFLSGQFDVVLMDVQMPVMDGLQATRAIRDFERNCDVSRRVPIIAMTAFAGSEDRRICIGAGMDDYITKPIKQNHLIQLLQKYCDQRHDAAHDVAAPQDIDTVSPVLSAVTVDDDSIFGHHELLERLAGRTELVSRFIGLFRTGFAQQINGLMTSLEQNDAAGIARCAHAIKGSAGNISALRIHETASQFEKAAKEGNISDASQRIEDLQREFNVFIDVVSALGFVDKVE